MRTAAMRFVAVNAGMRCSLSIVSACNEQACLHKLARLTEGREPAGAWGPNQAAGGRAPGRAGRRF